jgi:hypothetical protein
MPIGRFHIAVLVGTTSIRALRFAVVVIHQSRVPIRYAFCDWSDFARLPPENRCDDAAAHHRIPKTLFECRHSTLRTIRRNTGTQTRRCCTSARNERTCDRICVRRSSRQVRSDGEVTGCQSPRVVILTEEDSFPRSVKTPPFRHSTFECPPRGIRKLTFVSLLKPFKQSLRLESRFPVVAELRPKRLQKDRPASDSCDLTFAVRAAVHHHDICVRFSHSFRSSLPNHTASCPARAVAEVL